MRATDLNPDNVGRRRFGVEVWDGGTRADELVDTSDGVLITGTALVNGTYDRIRQLVQARGRTALVHRVTAAGVADLLGLERLCPYGR